MNLRRTCTIESSPWDFQLPSGRTWLTTGPRCPKLAVSGYLCIACVTDVASRLRREGSYEAVRAAGQLERVRRELQVGRYLRLSTASRATSVIASLSLPFAKSDAMIWGSRVVWRTDNCMRRAQVRRVRGRTDSRKQRTSDTGVLAPIRFSQSQDHRLAVSTLDRSHIQ